MVEKILEVEAAKAVDTSGKKLKKTAHVLIAGVVSYPLETKYLKNNDEKLKLYEEWQKRTIKHIDQEFGADNVMCILEHTDEEYPHLHFYVKPKLTPDKTYTLDDLHPGRRAVKEMGGYTKENGKQRRIAYKAGMREFQDRFYNSVSSYFAHARTGPRRQRLTREGWKAQTEINKQNALLKIENEALQRQIEQLKNPPPPPSRLNFSAEKMEEFRLEKSTQILRRQFKI
jgi:hypothetical protein